MTSRSFQYLRNNLACDWCRKIKSRCTIPSPGSLTCETCARRDSVCTFKGKRKRRPQKDYKYKEYLRKKDDERKQRNKHLQNFGTSVFSSSLGSQVEENEDLTSRGRNANNGNYPFSSSAQIYQPIAMSFSQEVSEIGLDSQHPPVHSSNADGAMDMPEPNHPLASGNERNAEHSSIDNNSPPLSPDSPVLDRGQVSHYPPVQNADRTNAMWPNWSLPACGNEMNTVYEAGAWTGLHETSAIRPGYPPAYSGEADYAYTEAWAGYHGGSVIEASDFSDGTGAYPQAWTGRLGTDPMGPGYPPTSVDFCAEAWTGSHGIDTMGLPDYNCVAPNDEVELLLNEAWMGIQWDWSQLIQYWRYWQQQFDQQWNQLEL